MTESPVCQRCHLEPEDEHHVLRGCTKAGKVWEMFLGNLNQLVTHLSVQDWIEINVGKKGNTEFEEIKWLYMFSSIVWHVWKERNKDVIDARTQELKITYYSIIHYAREVQNAFSVILSFHPPKFQEQ